MTPVQLCQAHERVIHELDSAVSEIRQTRATVQKWGGALAGICAVPLVIQIFQLLTEMAHAWAAN